MYDVPNANIFMSLGLVEVLDDLGGSVALDDLRDVLEIDLDQLADVLSDAEMLGLVRVENNNVSLTEFGKRIVSLDVDERQDVLVDKIKSLPLFKIFLSQYKGRVGFDEVKRFLVRYSNEVEIDKVLNAFLDWGRFAGIFDVDKYEKAVMLR